MSEAGAAGPGREEGSVLLLILGWCAIAVLAIVVTVDASAALLQRQRLQALADATALAGAQAIDLSDYYANGASAMTTLDGEHVGDAVREHLRLAGVRGVSLDAVSTDGKQAVVALSAPLVVPFLGSLIDADVRVEAAARLGYQPPSDGAG